MRKDEFLNELRNRLVGLPKDDLENRISFYDEMIEDRIDEGKTEEAAVEEVGPVEEVVRQIASETSLVKLVKEKATPKRSLKTWEIILLILGFPLWFPLVLVAFILCLVGYLLIWILVIVTYVVEGSLIVSSLGGIVGFFAYLFNGTMNLTSLGTAIGCAGAALLFIFACIGATKVTIKLSRNIVIKIKTAFIGRGK